MKKALRKGGANALNLYSVGFESGSGKGESWHLERLSFIQWTDAHSFLPLHLVRSSRMCVSITKRGLGFDALFADSRFASSSSPDQTLPSPLLTRALLPMMESSSSTAPVSIVPRSSKLELFLRPHVDPSSHSSSKPPEEPLPTTTRVELLLTRLDTGLDCE